MYVVANQADSAFVLQLICDYEHASNIHVGGSGYKRGLTSAQHHQVQSIVGATTIVSPFCDGNGSELLGSRPGVVLQLKAHMRIGQDQI